MRPILLIASCLAYTHVAIAQDRDWPYYGADAANTKFAPVAQIDSTNFDRLKVVWRWRAPDADYSAREGARLEPRVNQNTPLVVDGVLYTTTTLNIVAALDAATGEELWTFDPGAWREDFYWNVHRGVAYWRDGEDARILFGTFHGRLYSLDAKTGRPDPAFGQGGYVDLYEGIDMPEDMRWSYGVNSPPIICRDIVAVGGTIYDYIHEPPGAYTTPGDLRGFDVRTGQLRWTFHTIPREGEYGADTWDPATRDKFGSANVWSIMSADHDLGYLYVPVSTPSHDFYGGERPGDNLFGDSIVCLDAATGERVWHFQIAHHGLWDYDPPAAPILLNIEVDGEPVRAVAQLTKQALCFVFDRVTGEPVWPIVERPVPASTVPGEQASPTQPFPTKPPPYDRHGLGPEDLIDFTPELNREAREILARYDHGPIYTPPSERGAIAVPGNIGGSDWTGGAAHPQKGWIYVPSRTQATVNKVYKAEGAWSAYRGGRRQLTGPRRLPLFKPPYGRLTAIDLNTGEHVWTQTVGAGPVAHPALRDLDLPPLGWDTRKFPLATPTLLLIATMPAAAMSRMNAEFYIDPEAYLRAYDLEDGRLVGRVDLPDNAYGNPMTYVAGGRQYIIIPTGDFRPAELIALALPRPGENLPPQGQERGDADHPSFYQAVAAIDRGDAPQLRRLLAAEPGLARARGYLDEFYRHDDLRGASLLHLATGHPVRAELAPNALDLAGILIAAGADPNAVTLDSIAALELAARGDQLGWRGLRGEFTGLLLQAGADPDYRRGKLMWQAIVDGDSALVAQLLGAGARLDLRFAASLGRVEEVAAFFDAAGGLRPEARGFYRHAQAGHTRTDQDHLDEALSYAAAAGHLQVAALLLDRGADPNALTSRRDWDQGSTALHKAASFQRREMVSLLLKRGADPFAQDANWGDTALGWAQWGGDGETTDMIKEWQARAKEQKQSPGQ